MRVGAGVRDGRTRMQRRQNTALQLAAVCGKGGRAADEALAAVGQIGAEYEVQLTACAADVLGACGLCVNLTGQVEVNRVVDGNKVVNLGNNACIVGVANRCAHQSRIVIHVVIHLLGAGAESEYLTALVDVFLGTGQLAGSSHIHKAVYIHLGVHAQILQIRLCNQRTYGVRHAANAQLQASAVRNFFYNQLGYGLVDFRRRAAAAHLTDRRVVAFNDHVYIGDVNAFFKAAQTAWHVLVDFYNDLFAGFADSS